MTASHSFSITDGVFHVLAVQNFSPEAVQMTTVEMPLIEGRPHNRMSLRPGKKLNEEAGACACPKELVSVCRCC